MANLSDTDRRYIVEDKIKTPSPWSGKTEAVRREESPGMKVHLALHSGEKGTARNVTGIHYGYESSYSGPLQGPRRIAFESSIHSTGFTHDIEEIAEFEVSPETEIASEWWHPGGFI